MSWFFRFDKEQDEGLNKAQGRKKQLRMLRNMCGRGAEDREARGGE